MSYQTEDSFTPKPKPINYTERIAELEERVRQQNLQILYWDNFEYDTHKRAEKMRELIDLENETYHRKDTPWSTGSGY